MEISRKQQDGFELLVLDGRLDAYWADHLESEISGCIREGHYKIMLDMSSVSYLSSAGIRVLLQSYKKLNQINGLLILVNISNSVKSVLELSGVHTLLKPTNLKDTPRQEAEPKVRRLQTEQAHYEIFSESNSNKLTCEVSGSTDFIRNNKINPDTDLSLEISDDCYSLGIGAFGDNYEDCKNRFGEYLAVAGGVTYLPTDGTNVPDSQNTTGNYLPQINTLYSLTCKGDFAYMARFETTKDRNSVALSDLIEGGFNISEQDTIAVAVVAESAGIVGANLIKSPVLRKSTDIFSFPDIQNCISFTSEKSYIGSLAVLFGIATKEEPSDKMGSLLRPIGDGNVYGHFHAMIFSYEPLIKGKLDLQQTVKHLFERQSVQSVVHLLSDNREIVGAGQSEFIRGGLWVGPIK
ncbi:MAG: anti-sigma factor antagonist [Candidatus Dadabacteria bacterium]|nr:anti-sigma factor antagonist [Candidatus Dadabacteria bacterium]NIX14987.1 anti-sigma factor antagonist [Candidatus Dadabacteria bacterium]